MFVVNAFGGLAAKECRASSGDVAKP